MTGLASFESKVGELMVAGKTKAEAIRQVARDFPELHDDYINRAQDAGPSGVVLQPEFKMSGDFQARVKTLMETGKTRGEAICFVAHNFPGLHQNYIADANR